MPRAGPAAGAGSPGRVADRVMGMSLFGASLVAFWELWQPGRAGRGELGGQQRDLSEDLGLGAAESSAQGWEEAWLVGKRVRRVKKGLFKWVLRQKQTTCIACV